jgi:hypothetical protein
MATTILQSTRSYCIPGGPLRVLKEEVVKTSDYARGSDQDIAGLRGGRTN